MKRKKILMLASVVMMLSSCNKIATFTYPYPSTDNVVRLVDDNMPTVEFFSIDKVVLPEEYANARYYVYNDSVVIIINYEHPSPYMVTFYNLKKQNVMAGFITKGNGPSELISVMANMTHNYLSIVDVVTNSVSHINIDSVLLEGDIYKPTIVKLECFINANCIYVENNMIIASNPMYINDGYGVDSLPEFLQFDATTGNQNIDYKENDINFPSNLTQRTIAYCNSKYVAFWYCFPIITIYDKDFNIVKMYRDDKFNDPIVVKNESSALLADGVNDFLLFSQQTENYIFATNGRSQISREELKKKGGIKWIQEPDFNLTRTKNQELWCFDNDMNLVRRFKCRDRINFIRNSSYNEKTKNLFITAMDEDGEDCLFRCIFDN